MKTGMERAIVITGASSGIGRTCATYLAARGFRVFAGVRRDEDADRLRAEDPALCPLHIDVTDPVSVAKAAEKVCAETGNQGLAGLVNNAGIAVAGPLEFLPIETLRRQLDVNVISVITVSQAFLPLLRAGSGRIVNMGSISGRIVYPLMGPYAASKHALAALSIAQRLELAPWRIPVSLIEPGVIRTAIWEKSARDADTQRSQLPPRGEAYYGPLMDFARPYVDRMARHGVAPERVARAAYRALTVRSPRPRYLVGMDARLQACLTQWIPERLRLAILSWGIRYITFRREPGSGGPGHDIVQPDVQGTQRDPRKE